MPEARLRRELNEYFQDTFRVSCLRACRLAHRLPSSLGDLTPSECVEQRQAIQPVEAAVGSGAFGATTGKVKRSFKRLSDEKKLMSALAPLDERFQ